jgi:sterol desaturase/sphingolipid hydroxylase (fatty acid hydroxylase superfamily)
MLAMTVLTASPDLTRNLLTACAIAGFGAMEILSGRYQRTVRASGNDTRLELAMLLCLLAIAQPVAVLVTNALGGWLAPGYRGCLAGLPGWAMVLILLLGDDLTQYWWHRLSHSRLLWPLHRAHHSARYMSIRMTFRNNLFYYLMMPGLWIAGALLYLGIGGMVYALYMVVKLTVILGAHSSWRWDEPLYKVRALRPLLWVLERTISTPATHWAHHAITNHDGVGHYTGNFGNLLFFWDVLFGTAHITRRYPAEVGLIDDKLFGDEHWSHQMLFPLLRSKRAHTALELGAQAYVPTDEEDPRPS